ncbi:SsgA family sporulation/cell division regulator [Saccharomonospora azurea]|uniref:SsgA family sporulation/cell division regulator n=1 Tax=Saccharomonospora azurea TaxID=40988 RepID=UPI00331DBAC6
MPYAVTAELTMALQCEDGRLGVPAVLSYTKAEPFAVELTFYRPLSAPVRWTFARSLISTALTYGNAGRGDVRFSAGPHPGELTVHLSSPDGEATLYVSWHQLRHALERTHLVVPEGQESTQLDWRPLERLLAAARGKDDTP